MCPGASGAAGEGVREGGRDEGEGVGGDIWEGVTSGRMVEGQGSPEHLWREGQTEVRVFSIF